MRSELTNINLTATGLRSSVTNNCGRISRTKPPYVLLLGLAVLADIGYIAGQPDSDPRERATAPAPQLPSVTKADEHVGTLSPGLQRTAEP